MPLPPTVGGGSRGHPPAFTTQVVRVCRVQRVPRFRAPRVVTGYSRLNCERDH